MKIDHENFTVFLTSKITNRESRLKNAKWLKSIPRYIEPLEEVKLDFKEYELGYKPYPLYLRVINWFRKIFRKKHHRTIPTKIDIRYNYKTPSKLYTSLLDTCETTLPINVKNLSNKDLYNK